MTDTIRITVPTAVLPALADAIANHIEFLDDTISSYTSTGRRPFSDDVTARRELDTLLERVTRR